jgi:hypothetical protein
LQVFIQSKKFFQRFTYGQTQKKILHKLLPFQPNWFLRWSGNAIKFSIGEAGSYKKEIVGSPRASIAQL